MAETPSANAPDSQRGYRTSPDHESTGWPGGVPYIIGNEACERFSFYGMKAILFIHLTSLFALVSTIKTDADAKAEATIVTHLFFAGVYAFPMIGAILADRLLGKYQTIFYLSLVYCAGHAVLSFGENSLPGMYVGLALIAIGSGGIKPCVSANVGDQFGRKNWFRVRTIFQVFYFSVNFGSFFATLLIPVIRNSAYLNELGYQWGLPQERKLASSIAFGIPGVLMFIATIIFWMGRRKYVHVPAKPGGKLGLLDTLSSVCLFLSFGHLFFTHDLHFKGYPELRWVVLTGISIAFIVVGLLFFAKRQKIEPDEGFLAITIYAISKWLRKTEPSPNGAATGLAANRFWGPAVERYGEKATEGPVAVLKIISLFFVVSIFWALFDQHSSTWIQQAQQMDLIVLGHKFLPSQTAAFNPGMVMILIPLMNVVYSRLDKMGLKTTPLRRMTVGMLIASFSFVAVALIQMRIDALASQGKTVSVLWQLIPYVLITTAEVMVSITGLEFAYTQAPTRMKSTIMGFWLLAIAFGNVLVAFLRSFKGLPLVDFFWIFAGLMAGAALIFGLRAYFYVPKDYTQD